MNRWVLRVVLNSVMESSVGIRWGWEFQCLVAAWRRDEDELSSLTGLGEEAALQSGGTTADTSVSPA